MKLSDLTGKVIQYFRGQTQTNAAEIVPKVSDLEIRNLKKDSPIPSEVEIRAEQIKNIASGWDQSTVTAIYDGLTYGFGLEYEVLNNPELLKVEKLQSTVPNNYRGKVTEAPRDHTSSALREYSEAYVTSSAQILAIDKEDKALVYTNRSFNYENADGPSLDVMPKEKAFKLLDDYQTSHELAKSFEALGRHLPHDFDYADPTRFLPGHQEHFSDAAILGLADRGPTQVGHDTLRASLGDSGPLSENAQLLAQHLIETGFDRYRLDMNAGAAVVKPSQESFIYEGIRGVAHEVNEIYGISLTQFEQAAAWEEVKRQYADPDLRLSNARDRLAIAQNAWDHTHSEDAAAHDKLVSAREAVREAEAYMRGDLDAQQDALDQERAYAIPDFDSRALRNEFDYVDPTHQFPDHPTHFSDVAMPGQTYRGPIESIEHGHAIQRVGDSLTVAHNLKCLVGMDVNQSLGVHVEIRYPQGQVGIVGQDRALSAPDLGEREHAKTMMRSAEMGG